ncbi:MAG: shikimate dehydrogenase, partial [SAR202 cluster bacterium]|nr:shikimate dehydrogenase [SAR202 cluster bacterium]
MKYEGNIGIIGHPIGHSKSPVFQQVALDHHSIVEKFRAWDVSPDDLPEIMGHFKSDDFMAACVTLPHKINIIPYVDELTRTAKQVGAVN